MFMLFLFAVDSSKIFSKNDRNQWHCTLNIGSHTFTTMQSQDWQRYNMLHSDPEVKKFMAEGARNEDQNLAAFNRIMACIENNTGLSLAAVNNETGIVDGFFTLYTCAGYKPGLGEIVRLFDTKAQKQGLGTKSLQYLLSVIGPEMRRLNFTFNGVPLDTIYATSDPRNTSSWGTWDKMVGVVPALVDGAELVFENHKWRGKKPAYGAERYCVEYQVFCVQGYMPVALYHKPNKEGLN